MGCAVVVGRRGRSVCMKMKMHAPGVFLRRPVNELVAPKLLSPGAWIHMRGLAGRYFAQYRQRRGKDYLLPGFCMYYVRRFQGERSRRSTGCAKVNFLSRWTATLWSWHICSRHGLSLILLTAALIDGTRLTGAVL